MRLKSREKWVPGGFQVLHPEVGQKEPFSGSFSEAVRFEVNFRRKNPGICAKNGWSANAEEVEEFVEDYNARRCVAGGWLNFVALDVAPPRVPVSAAAAPGQSVQKKRLSLVAGVSRVADGARLLVDWLGDDQAPVAVEIAERRAAVCADCPKNDGGDWKAYFTVPIAEKIRQQMALRHDLELRTSLDNRLTVCSGCDCPLALKVWAPLDHVLAHTSEETKGRLDERCWVLREAQLPQTPKDPRTQGPN